MVTSYLGAKTLVTGADGFIGSHLTEALVAAGARVTALAQYNSFDSHGWLDDLAEATRAKVDLVRGDIRDAAFIDRLVRGQEIVFHLAALIAIPLFVRCAAVLCGNQRARDPERSRSRAGSTVPSGSCRHRPAKSTAPP